MYTKALPHHARAGESTNDKRDVLFLMRLQLGNLLPSCLRIIKAFCLMSMWCQRAAGDRNL